MRRTALLAAAAALAVTGVVAPATAAAAKPTPGSETAVRSLADDPAQRAAAAADQAVASGLDDLRVSPNETYRRTAVTPGGGMFYVTYERTYKGLPIVGGDAVVVTDSNGRVRDTESASGALPLGVPTSPTVSAEAATETAKTVLSRVDDTAAPRLVVLAWGEKPRLTWEAVVSGIADGRPSIQHVFVDAVSGEIADSYDQVKAGTGNGYYYGTVTINTSGSGSSYSMTDSTRSGIRCGGQNGSAYTGSDDSWGNGSGTNLETACVDALYSVQREWDMLRDWLGRNGINGSGGGFPARVGLNDVNAYWNGSYTNFGHSQDNARQATPIDVVAHEFGHAIFQTTSAAPARQRERRPERGHRRHLRLAHRGVRQQPERPAGLPGGREGQPRRFRADPLHVQPVPRRRPQLLLQLDPEHRGARRGRPAEPLVLPARRGLLARRRQAEQPDLLGRPVLGDRRRHPEGRQDLHGRAAAQDLDLEVRQRQDRLAGGGGRAVRREQRRVRGHQGGLERGRRAGAVGRGELHLVGRRLLAVAQPHLGQRDAGPVGHRHGRDVDHLG